MPLAVVGKPDKADCWSLLPLMGKEPAAFARWCRLISVNAAPGAGEFFMSPVQKSALLHLCLCSDLEMKSGTAVLVV